MRELPDEKAPKRSVFTCSIVTTDEVKVTMKSLTRGKTPGPDEIPNEILQAILPVLKLELALAISKLLEKGQLPPSYKQSTTITLKKVRKPENSLSSAYHPIILEKSLAKIIEKIVANRIVTAAAEHLMFP